MQLPHFLLREKPDKRHRLPQPHGILVTSEHHGEKHTVVLGLRNVLPLIVGRTPSPLVLPAMQIREHLSPDFPRRKATYNCKSDGPFELIQRLVRKAAASRGSNAALGKFQMIALADSPRLERSFRQNDAKGVTDTSHPQSHSCIIASYNKL
jgi:hypothetical protein